MILSARVSSSPGENLTSACQMGDGDGFNIMLSMDQRRCPEVLCT